MAEKAEQFQFTFQPTVTAQGDGSFVIRPGKPVEKLSLRQAARKTGLSRTTIYRLYDAGFIKGDRLSPRKIFIFADSLEAHLKSCRENPEFWEQEDRRARFLKAI